MIAHREHNQTVGSNLLGAVWLHAAMTRPGPRERGIGHVAMCSNAENGCTIKEGTFPVVLAPDTQFRRYSFSYSLRGVRREEKRNGREFLGDSKTCGEGLSFLSGMGPIPGSRLALG